MQYIHAKSRIVDKLFFKLFLCNGRDFSKSLPVKRVFVNLEKK